MMMLLFSISLWGQVRNFSDIPKNVLEQLDKMGIDNSPFLNGYESAYFNVVFKENLNGFDFTNKKVGFIEAGSKRDKAYYFEEERERLCRNTTTINGNLYIFNAGQKEESGGYDAAIVYWSKRLIPINVLIKKLKGEK